MSFKTTVRLDSKIFNSQERRRALSAVVSKNAKEFKNATKRRMIESSPGGKLYERTGGSSFTRSHRASRRGQRPAIDTGNLANKALKSQKISEFQSAVYIDNKIASYGEILQFQMEREIITKKDIKEAQDRFTTGVAKTIKEISR
jgi:hypothetical protein